MPAKATHVGQQLHPPNSCGSCESSRSHEVMVIHPACLPNLWLRNWLGDVLQLLTVEAQKPQSQPLMMGWMTRVQMSLEDTYTNEPQGQCTNKYLTPASRTHVRSTTIQVRRYIRDHCFCV